jgi:two-component system, NarL family, response regulator
MIRLGIVDDHPIFRAGLRRVFEREADLAVIWELGSVSELQHLLASKPVDVLLMDLNLGPDQDALAATRAVRESYANIKVIVISALLDWEAVAASRQAGACGYLPKDLAVVDMVAAIRGLVRPVVGALAYDDPLSARSENSARHRFSRHGLTKREQEVLAELRRGQTNRQIASRLGVSISTINKHVQQVLKKLQVRTRGQALARLHAEVSGRPYPSVDRLD